MQSLKGYIMFGFLASMREALGLLAAKSNPSHHQQGRCRTLLFVRVSVSLKIMDTGAHFPCEKLGNSREVKK